MKKEEIMMKHCSDNGLLSMALGRSILKAMEEYAEQQVKNLTILRVSNSVCSCDELEQMGELPMMRCTKCGKYSVEQNDC